MKIIISVLAVFLALFGYATWDRYTKPPRFTFVAPLPPEPFKPVSYNAVLGGAIAIRSDAEVRNISFEFGPDGRAIMQGNCAK